MKRLFLVLLFVPLIFFGQTLYQVNIITDIDYKENVIYPDKKDLLDIYIPEGKKNYPVIVYFHGGALLAGTKEMGKDIGEKLAKSGVGFVSANYRVSPVAKYPDHLNDASKISPQGFEELGIEAFNEGIISKGVLIDIPLLYNKDYIEAGTKISIQDIIRFEKKFNVKIEKGDVVLVRTGRWSEKRARGDWDSSKTSAGLNYNVAILLNERKVAVLGSDGTNDVQPSGIPEEGSPVHKLTLVAMGMPLLDNLNLEKLSKMAQKQKRWEFMISILPLRFKGGTGSPVNAIALF